MATKILRPTSTSGVEHSLSSGSNAAQLLSENSQDGDSTYIYQSVSGTSDASKVTTLSFGTMFSGTNYNVSAVKVYCVSRSTSSDGTSSVTVTTLVNGQGAGSGSSFTPGTSYGNNSVSSTDAVSRINQSLQGGSVPTIEVTVATRGKKAKSKDDDYQIRVTQVYVEITYEELTAPSAEFYVKESGSWKKYTQAYKKVNGQWVLQTNLSSVFSSGVNYVKGN